MHLHDEQCDFLRQLLGHVAVEITVLLTFSFLSSTLEIDWFVCYISATSLV